MTLNERALAVAARLIEQADVYQVQLHTIARATVVDCGIDAPGGLEAGRLLAETCLAGLGSIDIVPAADLTPLVVTRTDQPVRACMASQYAGWQIASGKFFAMGSGPMRAAAAKEELFQSIGNTEQAASAVGVLETNQLPTEKIIHSLAKDCRVLPEQLTLLVAPTASLAGTVQVVARSVETALHKMHELGFPLAQVRSGFGAAPLPPVAADDLTGIGRTNDAILYGGCVTLWIEGKDDQLAELGPRIPSCSSSDHGEPFGKLFERYDRDFYKIDPLLFSPAVVTLVNLASGRRFTFGKLLPEVLSQSFGTGS